MLDDRVRRLMDRIAKGLPVVVLGGTAPFVLAGCFDTGCGDYDPMELTIVVRPVAASDGGVAADAGP